MKVRMFFWLLNKNAALTWPELKKGAGQDLISVYFAKLMANLQQKRLLDRSIIG